MAAFEIIVGQDGSDCRRQGLGTQILQVAEREAMARGSDRVFLDTMDYQGPEFYESCGYVRCCELADWDSHGHAKYFYAKELGDWIVDIGNRAFAVPTTQGAAFGARLDEIGIPYETGPQAEPFLKRTRRVAREHGDILAELAKR